MTSATVSETNNAAGDSNAAHSPSEAFVELVGVEKSFGTTPVLRGVNLSVPRGKVLTILGGSGSGKSVMLKHMIGLLRADAGSVFADGRDVTRLSEREW
ncbi:MAG: phospholipid/cholesterol/gamma-HCH transport system ATP-binding protein, partial [Myxococcota bacterium]